MCAGIVDKQYITFFNFRHHPVNGELIVVFTQTAGDVILMVTRLIFFAQNRNMMVRTIHSRTHQIGCAGIHTDILFVDVFFVKYRCDQPAIRCQHIPAHLGKQGHISHAFWHQDFLILLAHAFADFCNIIAALIGTVRNPNAAGKIDKLDLGTGAFMQANRQAEQNPGQFGVVFIGHGVAGQKRMDAEFFCAQFHQSGICFGHLVFAHTIFCVARVVHDSVAQIKHTARIVPAANGLGDSCHFFEEVHMRQVIQIDIGPQLIGFLHVLYRRIVGGEHDVAALEAACLAHQKFGIAGAVYTAAFFLQNLQNVRVRGSFDCKVFLKAFIPAESLVHASGIFPNSLFIIQMERRRYICNNLLRLIQRNKRQFFRHFCVPFRTFPAYFFNAHIINRFAFFSKSLCKFIQTPHIPTAPHVRCIRRRAANSLLSNWRQVQT